MDTDLSTDAVMTMTVQQAKRNSHSQDVLSSNDKPEEVYFWPFPTLSHAEASFFIVTLSQLHSQNHSFFFPEQRSVCESVLTAELPTQQHSPSRDSQSCCEEGRAGRARALYSNTTELEIIWPLTATWRVTRPVSWAADGRKTQIRHGGAVR